MKTGDLAKLFGVSQTTVTRWISEFSTYLTPAAQKIGVSQRSYTEDDILVLATIAKLSIEENLGLREIEERLKSGFRVEHPGVANFGVDHRVVPAQVVEQIVDATEIRVALERITYERDRLLDTIRYMETSNREQLSRKDEEIKNLREQLALLQRELGRAEGRLDEIERRRKEDN